MRQVLVDSRGELKVVEVPAPKVEPGRVLVTTAFSLISSGTELATLKHHSAGLVAKARSHPQVVRGALSQMTNEGISATADALSERMSRWNTLGYSLSGIVSEVGEGVNGLSIGDRVACTGAEYAFHADVVSVPFRMAVLIPADVNTADAAFGPVAAIAMQAIRRGGATIGDSVAVMGLGLVGLLTCGLLKSAGCTVFGVDPNQSRCDVATSMGASAVFRDGPQALTAAAKDSVDLVILTAATDSSEPINQAASLCRDRGRVVVVGDVGMNIDRDLFYRKELDLVMSRSLGPGRYDQSYEKLGLDYPRSYVRWTEERNIESCLSLMSSDTLDVGPLHGSHFEIDRADEAYRQLESDAESISILLDYGESQGDAKTDKVTSFPNVKINAKAIGTALIGPGEFARSRVLPELKRSKEFDLRAIVGHQGHKAEQAARQFGARYASTDTEEIFNDDSIEVVWITTSHESHAELAINALQSGKHVFLEKPVALNNDDARRVVDAAAAADRLLTVGFNRREAPASESLAREFADSTGPFQIIYRVLGDSLPHDHWLDDLVLGGGRILGEGVHFFDWMSWLTGEQPALVHASGGEKDLAFTATVEFEGGSTGVLTYVVGDLASVGKERVEVFRRGATGVLENFDRVGVSTGSGLGRMKKRSGKGHGELIVKFAAALRGEEISLPGALAGFNATACATAAVASTRSGSREFVERF